ncbi:MAG: hypothetical protein RLZZ11_1597, partial [Cyanobacteriota bacterium]
VVATVVNITGNLLLIHTYGAVAAAAVTVLTEIALMVAIWPTLQRAGLVLPWQAMGLASASALAVIGASWVVLRIMPGTQLVLAVLAIQLAFILRFLLQSVVAMLCFWSERAGALDRLLLIPYLFLSGLVAPLESYPAPIQAFAQWTPFPSMLAFPAALLAGEPVEISLGFLRLGLWCGLLWPLVVVLWRAGIRRYSAMGA